MTNDITNPRVVVIGLASCFGCQLQITNAERHLLSVVGQIDLRYWQLASDEPMPEEFDIAIIEGAVTTEESAATVKRIREKAACVIAIGACATTGGIPAMAVDVAGASRAVYGETVPSACGRLRGPVPVHDIIKTDYEVRCCPIDFYDFVNVLQQALYGSNRAPKTATMCGECKRNGRDCFYEKGQMCLGMVTIGGCKARCVNLNRPCNGCRGLSPAANLAEACAIVENKGLSVRDFVVALGMFNQSNATYRDFCAEDDIAALLDGAQHA